MISTSKPLSLRATAASFTSLNRRLTTKLMLGDLSRINLYRLDNLIQVIWHLHRAIGEVRPTDAALAKHIIKRLRIGRVVRDRCRRVFELMAGEDADDSLVGADYSFGPQF